MSIEHGFESPIWMSKAVIVQSDPRLLKIAVCEVIDQLADRGNTGISPFEVIDRLVQVSAIGKYIPPENDYSYSASYPLDEDGNLTPDQEKEIQDFIENLSKLPDTGGGKPYKEWLKDEGIPDIDDFRRGGEEEDEDEQE